jgi:hypothetical protein
VTQNESEGGAEMKHLLVGRYRRSQLYGQVRFNRTIEVGNVGASRETGAGERALGHCNAGQGHDRTGAGTQRRDPTQSKLRQLSGVMGRAREQMRYMSMEAADESYCLYTPKLRIDAAATAMGKGVSEQVRAQQRLAHSAIGGECV